MLAASEPSISMTFVRWTFLVLISLLLNVDHLSGIYTLLTALILRKYPVFLCSNLTQGHLPSNRLN